MILAIADPPYLGRAKRWYGAGGCGDGRGRNQADNHPDAAIWDNPETHQELLTELLARYDGFAIAMSVHSLSTYLDITGTDSRNGFRVCVWHKPSAITSGSRITNNFEPVLIKVPDSRRGWASNAARVSDVLVANPPKVNFRGAKPALWTKWVLDLMGYTDGDTVDDLFVGSGMVGNALENYQEQLNLNS